MQCNRSFLRPFLCVFLLYTFLRSLYDQHSLCVDSSESTINFQSQLTFRAKQLGLFEYILYFEKNITTGYFCVFEKMCKFNQNLFIVWCSIWLVLVKVYNAYPVDFMLLDELIDEPGNEPDHDLTYDQRQNGTENIRLHIDGVIVALPSSSSNQASSSVGNLAANYLLQLAAGADDDDDSDYFPFVKNANNENGVTAPSAANEKETVELAKDKKKITSKPEQPNSVKRVVIVKPEVVKNEAVDVPLPPQRVVDPVAALDEQSKLDVIPVKKIQSRRKNK